MAAITVRNLDDEVRDDLRLLAARHGRSMEAEVRAILTDATGRQRRSPNALMDLYWASRSAGGIGVQAPERAHEEPRVDFTDPAYG